MKIENLSDLRLLVETVRGGTLTAAGRALGVSPAAASASLKRLENRLGERLFERSTRAVRLTSQGQTLLQYATRAMELLEEGEAQLASERRSLVGTVRVATSSDLTRSVLLPWFDEFMAAHPGVRLVLMVSDRMQDVTRDAVDLALRYGELADSRLVARTLVATRRVLCASPSYLRRNKPPRTPHDLVDHNCLTFYIDRQRYFRWRFEKAGRWTRKTPSPPSCWCTARSPTHPAGAASCSGSSNAVIP
jgi:DNA-binding transcriptional LysR family regulator